MTIQKPKRDAVASKKAIVDAAIRVFAEAGFAGASFQRIADLANVSQANVFYHFPSREDLVDGALMKVIEDSRAQVTALTYPEQGARDALLAYGLGNFRWALENSAQMQILSLAYYLGGSNPRFSQRCALITSGGHGRVEAILRAGIREKVFPLQEKEVSWRSELLHDALLGCIQKAVSLRFAESAPAEKTLVSRFKTKWLHLIETWAESAD